MVGAAAVRKMYNLLGWVVLYALELVFGGAVVIAPSFGNVISMSASIGLGLQSAITVSFESIVMVVGGFKTTGEAVVHAVAHFL